MKADHQLPVIYRVSLSINEKCILQDARILKHKGLVDPFRKKRLRMIFRDFYTDSRAQ